MLVLYEDTALILPPSLIALGLEVRDASSVPSPSTNGHDLNI